MTGEIRMRRETWLWWWIHTHFAVSLRSSWAVFKNAFDTHMEYVGEHVDFPNGGDEVKRLMNGLATIPHTVNSIVPTTGVGMERLLESDNILFLLV